MGSRLDYFREHCAAMAVAEHKPECPMLTWVKPYWSMWTVVSDEDGIPSQMVWNGPPPRAERPHCDGCNSAADRDLFARLAAEVASYQDDALFV